MQFFQSNTSSDKYKHIQLLQALIINAKEQTPFQVDIQINETIVNQLQSSLEER